MPKKSSNFRKDPEPTFSFVLKLLLVIFITILPVCLSWQMWLEIVLGKLPRAWDGSGHYALAEIYNKTIFPGISGWTNAYFSGMPFPNFYPPLFYWLTALISHTHLITFETAFKLVICLPTLLLPAAIWYFAHQISDKNSIIATGAVLPCILLLIDYRCRLVAPSGLDYVSTFQVGLYTQPLGFVLLLLWLSFYLKFRDGRLSFALTSVLLALTVLTNFFCAIVAAIFVIVVLFNDFIGWLNRKEFKRESKESKKLFFHFATSLVAFFFTLFWTLPMILQIDYFVTRPQISPFFQFIPATIWTFYLISIVGFIYWILRPNQILVPFLVFCLIIEIGIVFTVHLSFLSFPLQPLRFLTMLNFLLCIPFGFAFAGIIKIFSKMIELLLNKLRVSKKSEKSTFRLNKFRVEILFAYLLFFIGTLTGLWFIKTPLYDRAYYAEDTFEKINGVLNFALEHREGKYLVEIPQDAYSGSMLDARAINSYLGSQGNQTLSVVFREASPNSLFFNPQISVLSTNPDNFGISSVLADDLDFREQPLSNHLKRIRFVGVRYIVVASPIIKKLLASETDTTISYDSGVWTIYEIKDSQTEPVRVLPYLPALFVSDLSVKLRTREDYNFVRLAEEQFSDAWFDVLLANAPNTKIDEINNLNLFGAIILDNYECNDEEVAFERLRNFANSRTVFLIESDASLFHRIRKSLDKFPLAQVIERESGNAHSWLTTDFPTIRYGSSNIRRQWKKIRSGLEIHKVPTDAFLTTLKSKFSIDNVEISYNEQVAVPVLIKNTFHPNWQRNDHNSIYIATPFFQLTFVENPVKISYCRRWFEIIGLITSSLMIIILSVYSVYKAFKTFGVKSKLRIERNCRCKKTS
ncbi:MAG: hypothetical protein H0U45_11715 [Tatlockia sp.]|jgi:hypothetical protein|nr:hypothetical protein [Tatlockia sp.]